LWRRSVLTSPIAPWRILQIARIIAMELPIH